MQAVGALAMIPKARGMYAKHLTMAEYEELMRRRTVPEVAVLLKRHPCFRDSLATLSTVSPHRGQIEELLSMDVFRKYETLLRYDFSLDGFSAYYLTECEVREVLVMLHLLSAGMPQEYVNKIPPYLVGRVRIDLFKMAGVRSFSALLEVLLHTPYYKVLQGAFERDPDLRDFTAVEAELLRFNYSDTFALVETSFSGQERTTVRGLFLQEAEIHNLDVLVRIKTFYPNAYTPAELEGLLIPYTLHFTRSKMQAMARAPTIEALMALVRSFGVAWYISETQDVAGVRILYRYARRLLRLTTSPSAALAAYMCLARLERENIVNVVEGVRYGLPPERIREMLRF